jgi:hypothetical protein
MRTECEIDCEPNETQNAVRRRLGRTRTTVYLPLGERMAASCHGMWPRGRNGRPLGRHSASPLHALHIWRRVQNDRIVGAVVGTSGVGGGLAAWFASLVVAETGRAGRATDSGTTTRAQARTWTLSGALTSTLAQSSAISSTQAAITSNQQHSVAPRRRPTPSSLARALLPPLPLTAKLCAVPSRFLIANDCMRWRAVMGATAQRQQACARPRASEQVEQAGGGQGRGALPRSTIEDTQRDVPARLR